MVGNCFDTLLLNILSSNQRIRFIININPYPTINTNGPLSLSKYKIRPTTKPTSNRSITAMMIIPGLFIIYLFDAVIYN